MNIQTLLDMNDRPKKTIQTLLEKFDKTPRLMSGHLERLIPVGIEIECSWKSFFPDLWVKGFPNVPATTLEQITQECSRREQTLLPKLTLANQCGVPSGADKYWEFAFDPVTDVSLLCNQVEILCENQLIPRRFPHALHITLGGVKPSPTLYFITMILEAYACNEKRLRSAFGADRPFKLSQGWARKGRSGVFLKEGAGDLQHGYDVGTEIRTLCTPETTNQLFFLLDTAQRLCELTTLLAECPDWADLVSQLRAIIRRHNLPDGNWELPRENPQLWERIALAFPSIQQKTREAFEQSPFYVDTSNITRYTQPL